MTEIVSVIKNNLALSLEYITRGFAEYKDPRFKRGSLRKIKISTSTVYRRLILLLFFKINNCTSF